MKEGINLTEKALGVRLNIKNNIRILRETNGLKMREIAQVLGIKENTYRVWEDTGKETVPKADGLVELAKIFNVSLDFLIRSEAENKKRIGLVLNASNDGIYGDKYLNELSGEEKLAVMKMRRMTTTDKKKVQKLIDEILNENVVKLD